MMMKFQFYTFYRIGFFYFCCAYHTKIEESDPCRKTLSRLEFVLFSSVPFIYSWPKKRKKN